MSSVRLIIFIQALTFFVIGIYLSSQGLPFDEGSATIYAGEEIIGSLSDVSDSPEVDNIANNIKSNFKLIGYFLTIISIVELIVLFISLFK